MDENERLVDTNGNVRTPKLKFILLILLPCLVSAIVGFLIGYLPFHKTDSSPGNDDLLNYYETLIKDIDDSFTQKIIDEVSAKNIRDILRNMTSSMHLAGTTGGHESALYVYNQWKAQNLDYVNMIDYDVLLSYPDPQIPNSLNLIDSNGTIQEFNITEEIYDKDLNYTGAPFPFLSYGPNGNVQSDEVYYVNYGTEADYLDLEQNGINVTGKIVICKYGATFRGDKVFAAQNHGAIGIILFDDPKRSAPHVAQNEIYPNGEFMPESGTQRGTIFTGAGDPLTPMYPSTNTAFRKNDSSVPELPKIVAQVIGYKDAKWIFELMEGNVEVKNDTWKGEMNVTYTYGGKLKTNQSIGINVRNTRKQSKIHNVVGMIEGSVEPDRYVLIGNHRDAWVLGSLDPTSGTATLLEISRTLSSLKQNQGWKPKRSIVFLSWDAEEYGLVGSTEWTEEFNKKLTANAVAYLNMDSSVNGNYSFYAHASPLLFDLLFNVTKKIPLNDTNTVFDRWLEFYPNKDKTYPQISSSIGSGSDYMSFQQRIGIPCLDTRYYHETRLAKYEGVGQGYALYHTSYETFRLIDNYIDPGFKSFRLMAIVMSELTRTVAESLILPFNCSRYGDEMRRMVKGFQQKYGALLTSHGISLSELNTTIDSYTNAAEAFHERLEIIDRKHVHIIRQYNEQLRNLERSFLDPRGIERRGYLHMLSAPGTYDQYSSDDFPGLTDALRIAQKSSTTENWNNVKLELSVVIYAIQSASYVLNSPINFERS